MCSTAIASSYLHTYCWEKKKTGVNKSHRRMLTATPRTTKWPISPPTSCPKRYTWSAIVFATLFAFHTLQPSLFLTFLARRFVTFWARVHCSTTFAVAFLTNFTIGQVICSVFVFTVITEVLRATATSEILYSTMYPFEKEQWRSIFFNQCITFRTSDISPPKHIVASPHELIQNCVSFIAPKLWEYDRSQCTVISLNDTIKDRHNLLAR